MRLFEITQTSFENFDQTIRSFLSKTMNSLGLQYSHSNIFGLIFDGIKGVMQNIMFYIEDALTEQNVFTATRKKSVYSLAKISGYEAYYGSAASGTLLGKMNISNGLSSKATKIYIPDGTTVMNNNNGMKYSIMLPTDFYVFDVSKPLITHEFKVVQGHYASSAFVSEGKRLETMHVSLTDLFDKQYIKVSVNGEEWTQVSSLYDMTENGKEYVCTIGYDNTFDIMFGNGIYGKILSKGDSVSLTYLRHNGSMGNILPDDVTDFTFLDNGYDTFGNAVNINDYMKLTMKNCISGGTNSDSIEFIRNMIGKNSRSLVLASEDNFKLFFKRFSFIGYVNCWSENNSMTLIATCLKNVADSISSVDDYFNLSDQDLTLSSEEKEMIVNTLDNSKRSFAGMTLKFQDPIIRKFAIICYVKINNTYDKESTSNKIKDILGKYFISNLTDTQFIAKSKLSEMITSQLSNVKSIDLTIYSEMNEKAFRDGYYEKYEYKLVNGVYQYIKTKVMYEADNEPGLDSFGNISLDTKLEMPILSSLTYYPNKDTYSKSDSFTIQPIQIYFI